MRELEALPTVENRLLVEIVHNRTDSRKPTNALLSSGRALDAIGAVIVAKASGQSNAPGRPIKYGAGVRDFLDRLVSRKLARRFDFRPDRGHVYHLHHSAVFACIGQDDNRNRRRSSAALIARKLMLLDYVLSQPTGDWYATEDDKVAFFTTRLGVPPERLPQRVYLARRKGEAHTTRYFIHKLPIHVTGHPPIPSFVFLVTDTTGGAFAQFLHDHSGS